MTTPIICKPTRWFLLRAFGMLAMFLFLGGWFYKDATIGYKKQNEVYLLNLTFAKAAEAFQQMQKSGTLTDVTWREYAAQQVVDWGDDESIIPATVTPPVSWPQELQDYALISQGQMVAWDAFTGRMKWDRKAPEKLHEAKSIREQWYVAYGLSALALYTLFVLVRTLGRSMSIDEEKIKAQDGRTVLLSDLIRLDLRKWGTKGLAYAYYKKSDGKEGCIRIDGLTYGGFQKEQGEPAEAMMQLLRKNFTGELIEYADETPAAS